MERGRGSYGRWSYGRWRLEVIAIGGNGEGEGGQVHRTSLCIPLQPPVNL